MQPRTITIAVIGWDIEQGPTPQADRYETSTR
jgi:hypothetical protein